MIKATFYRNSDNLYKGFSVSGHAGYAKSGKDIVCSAVSALTANTVNSIEKLTDEKFVTDVDKSGTIKFKFDVAREGDGQLLIKSLVIGICGIAKEYGDSYLQVYFKEV